MHSTLQNSANDLGGLATETLALVAPHPDDIGAVAAAKAVLLHSTTNTFLSLISKEHGSMITPQIAEKDTARDETFADIRRITTATPKAASLP